MANYTIQISNESGFAKSYIAFMAAPVVSAGGGQPPVFANAWATLQGLASGGWDSVTYDDMTYAYWGRQAPCGALEFGGVQPVNTDSRDSVVFQGDEAVGFGEATPGLAAAGSFQIVADADCTAEDGYVFGLAKPNGTPTPGPVATFVAEPNDTYTITPVERFYVTEGTYTPGEVIDVTTSGNQVIEIDFTGRAETHATVVQDAEGVLTVTYQSPEQA